MGLIHPYLAMSNIEPLKMPQIKHHPRLKLALTPLLGLTGNDKLFVHTKDASEGPTLALKPRADVTRYAKQGYQWAHKKS